MGPGTLYDNLQRLMDRGWIADAGDRDEEDGRRKYYRLTSDGRNAIRAEIDRLEKLFRRAKRHLPVLDARRP
jgi:DNA-binding PadR family transcriptional regulator